MPLQIVRNDITRMKVDAIVNAANSSLLGGGGVDGAIHAAAGPELLAECRTLHGCVPGQAKITKGYRLPAKYVIHTVGPIWNGGQHGERETLVSAYRSSLALAEAQGCATVAFPLISAGAYGYPKAEAVSVATETIQAFLSEHELTVYLVVYGRTDFQISQTLFDHITAYIDQRYVDDHPYPARPGQYSMPLGQPDLSASQSAPQFAPDMLSDSAVPEAAPTTVSEAAPAAASGADEDAPTQGKLRSLLPQGLRARLSQVDESFSQMLLRKIDERGITDAECYKKANVDRKLFSKIRSNVNYKPSKPTAIAFAISLELDMRETEELLRKAGYALSPSSRFDLIIEYFIQSGNYDIFQINEALFAFDQSLLGA